MKIFIIVIFLLPLSLSVFSKESVKIEPSWVYLKRAEVFMEKGQYAEAFTEARKSKAVFIDEKIADYYDIARNLNKDKTNYEIKKIIEQKRKDLIDNDNYPEFHELIADLYCLTNFLPESVNEYKKAIEQKDFFDYKQKEIELKYKLAGVYELQRNYDLADMVYREISEPFFKQKDSSMWSRIKFYIKQDPTLEQCFKIFRIDGIVYMKALFKIGKRAALVQRKEEALYYLTNASLVWFTYYNNIIVEDSKDFAYYNPVDFINYLNKKDYKDVIPKNDFLIDEILFFIGYTSLLNNEDKVADHFFKLAKVYSIGKSKENEIKYLVDYLAINKKHILSYYELTN